jgi:hypothetical protein
MNGVQMKQLHDMLRSAIVGARTRAQLVHVVLEHKRQGRGSLNSYNAATVSLALSRMTKFQGADKISGVERKTYLSCINSLFARVSTMCHFLNARSISITAHAGAILGRNDTQLYRSLMKRACAPDVLKEMSSQGFSNLLWSMGRLNVLEDEAVETLCTHACNAPPDSNLTMSNFNVMDVANCLVGLGSLGKRNVAFIDVLLDRALEPSMLSTVNEIIMSQYLTACAQLEIWSEARLKPLLLRLDQLRDAREAEQEQTFDGDNATATAKNESHWKVASFGTDKRALCSALWALVRLEAHVNGECLRLVDSHVSSLKLMLKGLCETLPEQNLLHLLEAFGTGQRRDEVLLEMVCRRALALFSNFSLDRLRRVIDRCEGFVAEDGHGHMLVAALRAKVQEKEEQSRLHTANAESQQGASDHHGGQDGEAANGTCISDGDTIVYKCVCVRVFVRVCVYVCALCMYVCAFMYVCMYVCIRIFFLVRIRVHL